MNLLRQLVDEELFRKDAALAIADAALLFVRAGGEVRLGDELTRIEVQAIARAREVLAVERALLLELALRAPTAAAALLDDGKQLGTLRQRLAETFAAAAAASESSGPRRG